MTAGSWIIRRLVVFIVVLTSWAAAKHITEKTAKGKSVM